MWARGRDRTLEASRAVVTDAEMLLNGEMIDLNARVPPRRARPWVVVNALAHSDRSTLEQLREPRGVTDSRPGGYNATVAFLAAEVLSFAAGDAELLRVQRDVLVPLELRLLGRQIPAPTTIGELAILVVEALEEPPVCRY
jgi:hypothetical protein